MGTGIALLFHYHGTSRRWVVSSTPRPYFTYGKDPYPLYRRLGGPQGLSGQVRKILSTPGFDPRAVQPVASRYTDYATRPVYANMTSFLFCCGSWKFQLLFRFLAAVDRRRRILSEMTMNKPKESFAIWNRYSLLHAVKDLITKWVYFNSFFLKRLERRSCALANILGTNNHNHFLFPLLSAQQPPVGQGLLIHEVSRSHTTTHHSR